MIWIKQLAKQIGNKREEREKVDIQLVLIANFCSVSLTFHLWRDDSKVNCRLNILNPMTKFVWQQTRELVESVHSSFIACYHRQPISKHHSSLNP